MMRGVLLSLLVIGFCQALGPELEELRKNQNASRKMFELPAGDQELLNEMNFVRQYIGSGFFDNLFKNITDLVWKGLKAFCNGAADLVKTWGKELYNVSGLVLDWGKQLFDSNGVLAGAGAKLMDFGADLGNQITSGVEKTKDKVLSFFGRKRRKRWDLPWVVDQLNRTIQTLQKPKNVFGPATNMNILTWNRRLAQLAMVKKDAITQGKITEIEYEGKLYRVTKYGTFATYVITHMLGQTIVQMFTHLRIGYLAAKMWFSTIEFPNKSPSQTIDDTYEIMFADRTEVGCYYTLPDTICIIGPLKTTFGMLYNPGDPVSECKYGNSTEGLCDPPPSYFYALREKYRKHLRPKIEKFEVVEGFDGKPPPIGHNFMLDENSSSKVQNMPMITSFIIILLIIRS